MGAKELIAETNNFCANCRVYPWVHPANRTNPLKNVQCAGRPPPAARSARRNIGRKCRPWSRRLYVHCTGRPFRRWWILNVTHLPYGVWCVCLWKRTGGWATSWSRMELPFQRIKSFFTCLLWTIVHSYLLITIYRLGRRQWPPARTYQKWPEND